MKLPVQRSKLEIKLEKQGCVFKGQELLANHEADPDKPCYCGRPNKALERPQMAFQCPICTVAGEYV